MAIELSIQSEVKKLIVVVEISAYEKFGKRRLPYKGFKYHQVMYFKIPLYIDSDKFMLDENDSVNAIIARNLDGMSDKYKEAAKDLGISPPDEIDFTIKSITSTRDEESKGIKEWKTVE